MRTSLKKALLAHLKSNGRLYFAIGMGYVLSIVLGAVAGCYVRSGLFASLSAYVEDLFQFVRSGDVNYWSVLLSSLRANAVFLLLIWVFGFTVIGMPLIAAFVLYKGVSFGFTAAMIIRLFGGVGVAFVLLLLLAQVFFAMPAYFFAAGTSLKMSAYLFRFFGGRALRHNSFSSSFFVYTMSFLLPLSLLCVESLYSAYAVPLAFRLLLLYFG